MILNNFDEASKYINTKTKHFTASEFWCKCGCKRLEIDTNLVDKLDKLRSDLGVPLVLTSAYRCPEHNKTVGGAVNSQHVLGRAADVRIPKGISKADLIAAGELVGFSGIGVNYETFVHFDTRTGAKVKF